jgi:phage-related protein
MADRTLSVRIVGDATGLQKMTQQAGSHLKTLAKAFIGLEVAKTGIDFLKDATKAAEENQAQMAILANQVTRSGGSWTKLGPTIEKFLEKASAASGFMKSELANSFGRLETATHRTGQSMALLGDAENLARARHIDLQSATQILIKAHMGNEGALKRLGIRIPEINKHWTKQQKAVALLAAIHKQYAGAASAYSSTAAGATARLSAQWEEFKVGIGNRILPILAKLATFLAANLPVAAKIVQNAISQATAFMQKVWAVWGSRITAIARGAWNVVVGIFRAAKPLVVNELRIIGDLLTGKWGDAWARIKRLPGLVLNEIVGIMKIMLPLLGAAASAIGRVLWNGITSLMSGLWGWVDNVIRKAINHLIDLVNWAIEKINSVAGVVGVTIGKIDHIGGGGGAGQAPANVHAGVSRPVSSAPVTRARGGLAFGAATGTGITVNVAGSVVTEQRLVEAVRKGLVLRERRNGRAIGSIS